MEAHGVSGAAHQEDLVARAAEGDAELIAESRIDDDLQIGRETEGLRDAGAGADDEGGVAEMTEKIVLRCGRASADGDVVS